jgi:hypothetical protein
MDKEDSYVTCQLFGQLGNQLYQTSATLSYAWDLGAIPVFPAMQYVEADGVSYNRERIFHRLDSSEPPRPFLNVFKESELCIAEKIPFQKDLILSGHFLSWKHFHHYRDRLLATFAPSVEALSIVDPKN